MRGVTASVHRGVQELALNAQPLRYKRVYRLCGRGTVNWASAIKQTHACKPPWSGANPFCPDSAEGAESLVALGVVASDQAWWVL